MGALVVIPARIDSQRLAGKVMLDCDGRPLVWHTWAAVLHWAGAADVVVATGDDEVAYPLEQLGVTVVRTWRRHLSGSSRVAEAAMRHHWQGGWVINVQADHPRVTHGCLEAVLDRLRQYPEDRAVVATVAGPMRACDVGKRDRVKVVVDATGEARWFTRLPLKYAHHHAGVYAWHRSASRHLLHMLRCRAAEDEGLEQLDWLHAGWTVPVAIMRHVGDGIDSQKDLARYRLELRNATAKV